MSSWLWPNWTLRNRLSEQRHLSQPWQGGSFELMFHFLCFENKCVWQFEAFILGPSNWILDIDIGAFWASAQIGQHGKHCINQYVCGGWRKMRSCRGHSHLTVSLSTSMGPLPHFTPQEIFKWPFTITQSLFIPSHTHTNWIVHVSMLHVFVKNTSGSHAVHCSCWRSWIQKTVVLT